MKNLATVTILNFQNKIYEIIFTEYIILGYDGNSGHGKHLISESITSHIIG